MNPFPKNINCKITIQIKRKNVRDEKIIEKYRIEIIITELYIKKNNEQVNKKREERMKEGWGTRKIYLCEL